MKLILTKKHLFTIYRSATIRIRKTFYKPTTQKLYPLIARPRPRAKRLTFIYQCKPGFWKPEEHVIVLLCITYYKKNKVFKKNNCIKLIVLVRQKRKLSKAEKNSQPFEDGKGFETIIYHVVLGKIKEIRQTNNFNKSCFFYCSLLQSNHILAKSMYNIFTKFVDTRIL